MADLTPETKTAIEAYVDEGRDYTDFEGLPPEEPLWAENALAVQAAAESRALGCSVLDVLDEWGIHGEEREDTISKAAALTLEHDLITNERFERERQKQAEERRKKPNG